MAISGTEKRVVVVDDSKTIQAMLDTAFSNRPGFRVVGIAGDAESAVEMIRRLMPDIVTIDLCMPYLDGATLLEMLSDLKSVCKIVVSDRATANLLLTARLFEAGASMCLSKSDLARDPGEFFRRILAAADALAKHKQASSNDARDRHPSASDQGPAVPALSFPLPMDEEARLRLIAQKALANPTRERQFDLITQHVAKLTAFPACLLTVIDRRTQWVKSAYGLEMESTPRHQAFCNYTIAQEGAFVIQNAASDVRFTHNSLVAAPAHIRSYAGHPVRTKEGVNVAALCVVDMRIRTVSKHVLDQLAGMPEIVAELVNQRTTG